MPAVIRQASGRTCASPSGRALGRRDLAAATLPGGRLGFDGERRGFHLHAATGWFADHFAFDGPAVLDRGERCHFGNGEGCVTRCRFLHLLERRTQAVREERRIRQHLATRHRTDPHVAGIAERGDVEAHAVERDADRRVVHQPRARHVQRHVRPAHVGNNEADARHLHVAQQGICHDARQRLEQVACEFLADGVRHALGRRGCVTDRAQAFERVLDLGVHRHQRETNLVADVAALLLAAQRHWHHGDHRRIGQFFLG